METGAEVDGDADSPIGRSIATDALALKNVVRMARAGGGVAVVGFRPDGVVPIRGFRLAIEVPPSADPGGTHDQKVAVLKTRFRWLMNCRRDEGRRESPREERWKRKRIRCFGASSGGDSGRKLPDGADIGRNRADFE